VTINTETATDDATSLSPGFAAETNSLASPFITENAAWFVTPDDPQHLAREGAFGDWVVLLGQFTVPMYSTFRGEINLLLEDGTAVEGIPFVPSPAALALLGLAGLVGSRRRSCERSVRCGRGPV
jgi:MYXO-CTERM domain-containing protein